MRSTGLSVNGGKGLYIPVVSPLLGKESHVTVTTLLGTSKYWHYLKYPFCIQYVYICI